LFRPITARIGEAIALHFGPRAALVAEPPLVPIDPKGGTNIEVALRNNWPAIQTYKLEASGEGLEFFPPKTEITIAAASERKIDLRVFADQSAAALREGQLRITGGASLDVPVRIVSVPHVGAVAWTADLDEDGSPEWVLESAQARAVFSTQDGGRWMEFTWKGGSLNFLPVQGVFAATGSVEVRKTADGLEFAGKGWTRTVRLDGAALTITQTPVLPPDGLKAVKQGNVSLTAMRESASRAKYVLGR
jgi:hypothetical protein